MRFFLLLLLFSFSTVYAQIPARPEPAKYINAYTSFLLAHEEQYLEQKLYRNFKSTSNQIVFVLLDTIPSTMSIEAFSQALFEQWGIGTKENNNGVLVVVVKQLRKIRIQTGYGMEALIPDALALQLIEQYLTFDIL